MAQDAAEGLYRLVDAGYEKRSVAVSSNLQRRRHRPGRYSMTRPPNRPPLAGLGTVYECPDCEIRYLDERRCPDCNLFCRRIDTGGHCPHCDEPVTISELADSTQAVMHMN